MVGNTPSTAHRGPTLTYLAIQFHSPCAPELMKADGSKVPTGRHVTNQHWAKLCEEGNLHIHTTCITATVLHHYQRLAGFQRRWHQIAIVLAEC